jgi:PucR family transcriptional regulator, purine catabolism regulatory protein
VTAGGAITDSSITVQMALRLPSLRRGAPHVVAGRENLNRPIRWVHSSEVPNIATLLKGNELLLMTGMGITRDRAEQRRFMRALDERGVAGVVIELGQVFDTLPPALVEGAESCGLPLVELHRQVPFVEVTEELHSSIVSHQLALLRRGDELHGRFTALVLEGAGIPEILGVLASTIANPVVLEKADGALVYHATHHAPDDEVLAAWALAREDPERDAGAAVRPVPTAGSASWGRIAVLPIDSPIDDFDLVALERAVVLVALSLLRAGQEALLGMHERGNFLADLAAGRIPGADAAARADALGFPARGRALLPLAAIPVRADVDRDEREWSPVWRTLRDVTRAWGLPSLIGTRVADGDTLIVLGISNVRRRIDEVERAVAELRAAVERQLGSADLVVIAAGEAVTDWDALPAALREAAETAALARTAPARPWHDATQPDVDRLLWGMRNEVRLREFARRRLAPIAAHDHRRASKLQPTLEALCAHGWSKSETARALNLNRQSLYPRLQRIERLLAVDLEDPVARLGIELAVRVSSDLRIWR